jgi:hypothetical protein
MKIKFLTIGSLVSHSKAQDSRSILKKKAIIASVDKHEQESQLLSNQVWEFVETKDEGNLTTKKVLVDYAESQVGSK